MSLSSRCADSEDPFLNVSGPIAGSPYLSTTLIRTSVINVLSDCQLVLLNKLDATSDRIHAVHVTKSAIRHAMKMPDESVVRAVERIKAYLLKPSYRLKHERPPDTFCYYGLIVQKQANFIPTYRTKTDKPHGESLYILNCHTCDKALTVAPRGSACLPNGCAAPTDFKNWQRIMIKCHRPRGAEIEYICPLCDKDFKDERGAMKLRLGANKLFNHLFKEHSDDEGRIDADLEVGRSL